MRGGCGPPWCWAPGPPAQFTALQGLMRPLLDPPQTLRKPSSGLRLLPPEGAVSSSSPSHLPISKVHAASPSLPGSQTVWVHPPTATLVLWCLWPCWKCLSLHSLAKETLAGSPTTHLCRTLSASAESWSLIYFLKGWISPERPHDYPVKALLSLEEQSGLPGEAQQTTGPGHTGQTWGSELACRCWVGRSSDFPGLSSPDQSSWSDHFVIKGLGGDSIQLCTSLARAPALCDGTGLAPECGTRDGWQGNQSSPAATRSGFPLVMRKRIRAQNSEQGAFILRTVFSLAYRTLETGKKLRRDHQISHPPSLFFGGTQGAPAPQVGRMGWDYLLEGSVTHISGVWPGLDQTAVGRPSWGSLDFSRCLSVVFPLGFSSRASAKQPDLM